MKRLLLFAALLAATMSGAFAYDFSYTYQGKTLYYTITSSSQHRVSVVNPTNGNYFSYVTGDVVIPDSVEYNSTTYAVISIGTSAFKNCTGLTSITIPTTVTSIECYAFQECIGLTSITIPSSVTSINERTFYGCSGLTTPNTYW